MKTMKSFFYVLIAVAMFAACNTQDKNSYTIRGTIDKAVGCDTIFLQGEKEEELALVVAKDGTFEITGSVEQPIKAMIGPATGLITIIFLENGATYDVKLTAERAVVSGGGELQKTVGAYDNSDEYFTVISNFTKAEEELMDKYEDLDSMTPEERTKMRELERIAIDSEWKAMSKVIEDPKASPLAKTYAILRAQDWEKLPFEKRIAILDRLIKETDGKIPYIVGARQSYLDEDAAEKAKANAKATLTEGMDLKDFEVQDANGNTVKFSEVVAKNKYTLLEFWASWCKPCRAEIPHLKKAYEKYKSKGFEIFSVSLDEKHPAWLQALKEENTQWLNYHDAKHFNGDAASHYAITAIPASFLFSQDGKLAVADENALRGVNLDEVLDEFFK